MTLKLWLLSMILSIIAPHIFKRKEDPLKNNTNHQLGQYFDHTMSAYEKYEKK
jgi:ABC-type transport system involved in cytochrome bd biosynthesis fused ATPase/permease subunit